MTEILARASRQLDEDFQDFAPKHGRVPAVMWLEFRAAQSPGN